MAYNYTYNNTFLTYNALLPEDKYPLGYNEFNFFLTK
jgi:hypothetical protein